MAHPTLITVILFWLFIVLQICHLASLGMFGVFQVDCTIWKHGTSVDCGKFSLYGTVCDGYCWKSIWLIMSLASSCFLAFFLLSGKIPNGQKGNTKALFVMVVTKPFFWSKLFLLSTIMVYNISIILEDQSAKIYVEVLVMFSKTFTLLLIFLLNYTKSPSREQSSVIIRVAFYICLLLFFADNFLKFLASSAQIAFKFYDVKHAKISKTTITDLMLMVASAHLYQDFFRFFLLKLFLPSKDILGINRSDLGVCSSNFQDKCCQTVVEIHDEDCDNKDVVETADTDHTRKLEEV